ncbi:hypothetical protein QVD17_29992 [Tagetes erecta]|uniref:Protein kinase domain-containing protein n=1 Tax=Tagetes erecta TaxID=13708 RepID=A0AAD8K0N9_TARER|nr:hypothetical protein QVD17_29992 [Tagetes erecta]
MVLHIPACFIPRRSNSSQNVSNLEEMPTHLRAFTKRELKKAMKVTKDTIIVDGRFGNICKAVVKSLQHPKHHIEVAVRCGRRDMTYKKYATQVKVLGAINHPNLIRLIGYVEDNVQMLVYEHVPNNSVFHYLHSCDTTPLSWVMRLKVAHDVACGLAYLHEDSNFQVTLGDFSSANILLDENWNAKLTDIGVAPNKEDEDYCQQRTTVMQYAAQYEAPECYMTGNLTHMCKVWSYGLFLYELITSRRPRDFNRPEGESMLEEWVKPYVKTRNFIKIIDPRLKVYSIESVKKLSNIAMCCLATNPKKRPKMIEVLHMVSEIIASISTTIEYPKKDDHPIKDNTEKWSFRALFRFK